jgi:hypothetical protein
MALCLPVKHRHGIHDSLHAVQVDYVATLSSSVTQPHGPRSTRSGILRQLEARAGRLICTMAGIIEVTKGSMPTMHNTRHGDMTAEEVSQCLLDIKVGIHV